MSGIMGGSGGNFLDADMGGMNSFSFGDSQRTLSFLIEQLTHIESEVYKIKYPSIRYPTLIPVDTSAPAWIPSVTYFSLDGVGKAEWLDARASDVPNAEVSRSKFQTTVALAGIGFQYTEEELAQAIMLRMNLKSDKAAFATRASEEFIDKVALFGSVAHSFYGLFNNPYITIVQASSNGATTPSTKFANKTAAQMLADFNNLITDVYTGSNTVEIADTVLVPVAVFLQISTTPFNAFSEKTVLDYIREKNAYTAETGRKLTIKQVRGLDTAGVGSVGRMMAYRRAPDVLKLHLPMPFRFLPRPWPVGPLTWQIPGIFRLGGVDVRLPGACMYMDGVC